MKKKNNLIGLTVNSFTSVSINPKLILWCLDKKSKKYKFFNKAKIQEIIFLSNQQKKHALYFAYKSNFVKKKHFDNLKKNSLCHLKTKVSKIINAGDHKIFICKINKFSIFKNKKPLIFYKSKFLTF